jgi:hypothetical protein
MKFAIIITSVIDVGTDFIYTSSSFFYYELMRQIYYIIIFLPTIIYFIVDCWGSSNSLMRRHMVISIEYLIIKQYMEFFWIEGDSIFFGLIKTKNN